MLCMTFAQGQHWTVALVWASKLLLWNDTKAPATASETDLQDITYPTHCMHCDMTVKFSHGLLIAWSEPQGLHCW